MQCSWNRSCSQCQNIYIFFQFFNLFFVLDTKSLFLIYNQKTKVFKLHILAENAMRPDHNIYQTFGKIIQCLFLFGRCAESTEQIDPYREFFHTLDKGIVMLLRQYCRWNQIHYLFIFLNRLKCCSNCNFRLSKSNITTNQTVHDLSAFHISLCGFNGCNLIFRLLKWKHFFKFPLPHCILFIHKALLFLTLCV